MYYTINIVKTLSILLLAASSQVSSYTVVSPDITIVCTSLTSVNYIFDVGEVLECKSAVASTLPNSRIIAVVHSDGSAIENVAEIESLNIYNSEVHYFPEGISDFLPNLKVLTIVNSGLRSVSATNLREFGSSLKIVHMGSNELQSLSGNLFEYNPSLTAISLHDNNQISFIDPDFFKSLQSLRQLMQVDLESSGCISQIFSIKNGDNINNFVWNNQACTN